MGHKTLSFIIFLLLASTFSFAQGSKTTSIVKGKLLNKATKTPLYEIRVSIPELNVIGVSDGEGNFSVSEVPFGTQTIVFNGPTVTGDTMVIVVDKEVTDLNEIMLAPSDKVLPTDNVEIPTIALEDNTANQDDDGAASQSSSSMFIAGSDPFLYTAAYTFGQFYFKPRGINNNELQLNGIAIEDLERGFSTWSSLGSLNDVLHGRNITYGLRPSGYSYGGTNGTTYVDATAADQRKGNSLTYTNYNRNYRNRVMYTHNSGLMSNGWAWSVSGSRRWAQEGYVPGTFYDGYSFYGAVSKVVNKGQFNLTAIASPTRRGRGLTATEEAYDITGDKQYNSAWGYQNGEKRNSRVVETTQPIIIANYTYRPSDNTRWNTAAGYEFGKNKSSTIDYYNAYSARPNYYRNLPSYYLTQNPALPGIVAATQAQLEAHPEQLQINWDDFYQQNYTNIETIKNVNGIAGNDVTGRRSLYILSNYVDDLRKFSFNSNIEHSQSEHLTLAGGVKVVSQANENYRQVADLLGGDYFLNSYQFLSQAYSGVQTYAQNDLNHPNQVVKQGDIYGYHYTQKILQSEAWAQAVFVYNKFDLFAALNGGYTTFSREGFMKNGLFPDHSYGKSPSHDFFTNKMKAGITYKIDLHNAIYANADYTTDAPLMSNTYISIATRDYTIDNPTTIKTKTAEVGYLLKSRKLNARITGYVSDVADNTIIKRFFYDELGTQSFVSYIMNNVSTRCTGLEFSANYRIASSWSVTGVASVGQYFYTNSPNVNIYLDNDPTVSTTAHKVYIKNYYLGAGPQSAYTFAVNYRPRSWNASLNFNYIDRNYIDIYPERRTISAVALVPQNSDLWNAIVSQEKLPAVFTTDAYVSKSFNMARLSKKAHRNIALVATLSITNLLNNQNIKVTGYEQLRYDFSNRTPDKFQNYYDYAFGINYSANITLRF